MMANDVISLQIQIDDYYFPRIVTVLMQNLLSFLSRDPLTHFLGEYNINRNNPRRCDLINRSRVVTYFDITDPHGREALRKVIKIASKPSTSSIVRLKYVMLLHSLVISSNLFYDFILDNEIVIPQQSAPDALAERNEKQERQEKGSPAKAVVGWIENAVQLYYNYVRRICMQKDIYQQTKIRLTAPTDWSGTIDTIFMLINLIKSAFPLREFILNIGRYFLQEYQVVADVNRILGVDLARTYSSIAFLTNELLREYPQKLTRPQCLQLVNIIDEIYLVHEELYVILYNRYYFGCMEVLSPQWFKIDAKDYEELKDFAENRIKARRKNISMVDLDIDIYTFQSTYFGKERKYSERVAEV